MRILVSGVLSALCMTSVAFAAATPQTTLSGMKNPESVCYGQQGLLYVTEIGEPGVKGDGKVTVIRDGKASTFAEGLDDPKGIMFFRDALYVTDVTKIVRIDMQGKMSVAYGPEKFPKAPQFLNDIAVDGGNGIILVTDSGDLKGKGGAAFRIDVRLDKIETVADADSIPGLHTPNGITFDGGQCAIVTDFGNGNLYRIWFHNRASEKIAEGMDGADGVVWDHYGRLFVTSWKTGKVFGIPRPGLKPVLVGEGLQSAADCCLDATGKTLLIPDMKSGTLTSLPTTIAGWEVDESPLAVSAVPAFPKLKFTGWSSGEDTGRVEPLRPILLTHAGDGSNRVFVPTQHGVIHVFPNKDDVTETKVFLDIQKLVRYSDKQNEEGLLGLAFHPKFKQNGEFFVFYTDVKAEMANVLSRLRVSKTDPNKADPASEEQLIRFEKPYGNHDGGTVAFGPDGYLYVTHGDGGAGGDPQGNGQKLSTLLGKILRIDVDKKANGKKYAIPADNPFVKQSNVAPEIWAYGLRNVWRMAFDRKTGQLWAGEVGQNLFEEIILVKGGGNYGWSVREALHPHGGQGTGVRPELIEPIWEYHHDVGRSITGGVVYRGKQIPELNGAYLYTDYVSGKTWALRYDEKQGRVVENHILPNVRLNALSYGEDEAGEVYITTVSPTGQGVYRLSKGNK